MTNYRDSIIRDSIARDQVMADRLRRYYDEHDGLRDMKDMQWSQASADETSAMRIIGWLFVVALAGLMGALGAAWWTGQPELVAAMVECVK